ncbi:MAG: UDP-N-acetylmuramoyl-L-alanyl-D-glutamate--2,6-diaminopimelate ligase [Bosea sp. (in: a-proteobacteria)]
MGDSEHQLGKLAPGLFAPDDATRAISSITADSRKVTPGALFFALAGAKADGRAFVPDAASKGAIAIIGAFERPADLPAGIAFARADDPRLALAKAAAAFHPGQPATIVAITGTSGKSSVADFTRQIFQALGHEAASLGTVGIVTSKGARYGSLTTPDPVSLHEMLHGLDQESITHLAMEASSHGLDQRRLDGVRLSAAAFLNLGRDHLDYHPTMDEYFAAKLRLFELLPADKPAVINADDEWSARAIAAAETSGRAVLTVGAKGEALKLLATVREGFAQRLTIEAEGKGERARHDVLLPLAGDFQAANALVAAGLAIATGAKAKDAIAAIAHLTGVPGRLERIGEVNGGLAIVDYAHKPDALAALLATLRPYATGKLICVFGCGGDRDKGKRPIMGRIAMERADLVIVTDDNPRTETPAAIRAEVMVGAAGVGSAILTEIGDREAAIRHGVSLLSPGDVLVVAGKGHETGQIIGDRVLPFSDHDVITKAISDRTT